MISRLFNVLQLRSRSRVPSSTTPSSRLLRLEPLETRALLSASEIGAPASAPAAEYAPADRPETTPIPLDALETPVLSAANSPTPLEKPVLNVTATTGLTITVSWDSVPNAERYSFSYKPSNETTWKSVNVGTNLSYTASNLKLDSDYDFRVKAIGDGVDYKSVYSAVVSAKTNATPDPSETPVRLETPVLTATNTTGLSITVSWDAVPNVERYSFSYKPSNETTWKRVNVGTDSSHTVSGLKLDSDYDFRVKAIGDGATFKSVYSAVVSARTNATPDPSETPIPLDTPVLTVAAVGSTSLTITWSEVPNAARYSLFYKPVDKTTWTIVNAGTDLSRTVSDLNLNAEYDVRVKAIGDGVDYKSAFSPILRVETASVHFQLEPGATVENQTLELYAPAGYVIYYTTDGSDPVASPENLYSGPLTLTANASRFAADSDLINIGDSRIYENNALPKAVTVKTVAVSPDGDATPIATRTYFFQERESVAVISISTDYDNLLDYNTGIMVKGAYYDAWINTPEAASIIANNEYWKYQGNYTQKGKNWERPATIEIFDGENYVVENCGIRLRGDASRMYAQKSFAFYFSEDYGAKELDYALFGNATAIDGDFLSSYKDFILRNGGNDTDYLKFHDALIQYLARNLNIAAQESRPSVLYLNGEYMGIYVMQERYDGRFFADHYLVDENNVVVAQEGAVTGGEAADDALYEELLSYANMDMTNPDVYNAFCNVVDVESMIDYYATEIYIANADWRPAKNTCLWRTRTPENDSYGDGKWRWALYDTEYSSSLYGSSNTAYNYNSFAAALNADSLFAGVMKNAEFRQAFTERMTSLAENDFSSAKVNSTLYRFSKTYQPYMSNYYKRFGDTSWAWNSNINGISNFFANRARYILNFVENYQP